MSKHKKIAQAIGIILAGFITLSAVVLSLSLLVTGLSMVFGVLSGAVSVLFGEILLLLSPLSLIGIAITALVGVFIYAYKYPKKFRAIIDDLGKILMHLAKVAIKAVENAFKRLWSIIKPIFVLWLKYIKEIWKGIKMVGHFFGKIFHAVGNKIKSDWHEIGNKVDQVAGKIQKVMDKKANAMGMLSGGDMQQIADNKLMFAATHQHEMSLNEKMLNAMQGNNQQVHVHIHQNDQGGFSHYISPFANGSTPTISVPNTSN